MRVGQRIPLQSLSYRVDAGSANLDFEIVGIFEGLKTSSDTSFVIARYDYINAARTNDRDTVSYFGVLPAVGIRPDGVIRAIDQTFANSANETQTRTEVEFMRAFVTQFADISTVIQLVTTAAFVSILMIVSNTMFFAVRERTSEIGVMKVLGFSNTFIMASVLVETLMLFSFGLAIGFGLAAVALIALSGPLGAIVPSLTLTPGIAMKAVGLAVFFALLTGAIPAINAMRMSVVSALKGK